MRGTKGEKAVCIWRQNQETGSREEKPFGVTPGRLLFAVYPWRVIRRPRRLQRDFDVPILQKPFLAKLRWIVVKWELLRRPFITTAVTSTGMTPVGREANQNDANVPPSAKRARHLERWG